APHTLPHLYASHRVLPPNPTPHTRVHAPCLAELPARLTSERYPALAAPVTGPHVPPTSTPACISGGESRASGTGRSPAVARCSGPNLPSHATPGRIRVGRGARPPSFSKPFPACSRATPTPKPLPR